MARAYPKHPRDILIRIIDRSVEDGILSGIATTAQVSLSDKLDDYLGRLGYSSAHITGIIVQLLTQGKVRVDFGQHAERIELVNSGDQLTSTQAMGLLDDFIAETASAGGKQDTSTKTQRIVVQPRRSARSG